MARHIWVTNGLDFRNCPAAVYSGTNKLAWIPMTIGIPEYPPLYSDIDNDSNHRKT